MSADASVTLAWAGEDRKFKLGIKQLSELQENVNRWRALINAPLIGPNGLKNLLVTGDAWPSDVREVIRLGLIGGGMDIKQVPDLLKRYVDDRPLAESAQVALALILAAIVGVPDDPVGKKPERRKRAPAKTPGPSASPDSTAPVQS